MNKNIFFILICSMVFFAKPAFSQETIISSGWQFSKGTEKKNWSTINIPHSWNTEDAFDDKKGYYRGEAWYRKNLFFDKSQNELIHYLHFKGVNQESTVFVNGKKVRNHKGGYLAFNFDITKFLNFGTYNLIEVKVDNSHNENIPPLDADFTFYGGIYRDVLLISKPKQHISLSDFASDGFYVNYYEVNEAAAGVEVTVLVENKSNVDYTNHLNLLISDKNGNEVLSESKSITARKNSREEIKIRFPLIKKPLLWTPETPNLYNLNIQLLDDKRLQIDSKNQKIGFRWISVDPNKGFYLNGKPYKLIGVNKHQDYAGMANAVPVHLQKKDVHLIKEMGGNIIRFAHYPHTRELHKLCDELGILVWSETPIVNKVTNSDMFFKTSLEMQERHIKQYYNYPSVVMFGYMNEIFLRLAFDKKSSPETRNEIKNTTYSLAEKLENLTRKLAPNHLTVMALHYDELYNETGIADLSMLIGWNLYFGWYHDKIYDLGTFLDEQHKRYPNRTIMVSEYGPGADQRIRTQTPLKYDFSEDYQLLLHSGYFEQVMERDYVAGMTAWNFADFGSEFRGDAIPHVNQKGLINYDRKPKNIYYWYKSVLNNKKPFAHISVPKHIHLVENNEYELSIFSNISQGELYLNEEKVSDLVFKNGIAKTIVQLPNGMVNFKVYDEQKNILTEKQVAVSILKDFKNHEFDRFGINVGSHFNFLAEKEDIVFVSDREYTPGLFGYIDGKKFNLSSEKNQGIPYNIRNTDSDPLFQTMLEGCTEYKVDIPNGNYQITLMFVEPILKEKSNLIYNLNANQIDETASQKRVFNIQLNNINFAHQLNLAKEYPEKYGVKKSMQVAIENNEKLSIKLHSVEGKTVLSGILIEKLN